MHKHLRRLLSGLFLCASNSVLASGVITLAPHLTELAFAAGITPVAVSAYSDYPPAAKNLEQVADWQSIKIERILALKPDLVLAWRGGNPQRPLEQLQALGIKVLWLEPHTLTEVTGALQQLKPWSPEPEKATAAITQFVTQEQVLRERYAQRPIQPVFMQFGQQPLFTASQKTLQNQALELCGGRNIFADSPVAWPQVSREQVITRKPKFIVITGEDNSTLKTREFWLPHLHATIITLNSDWWSRPGPRILLAAEQLCRKLHPDQ